MASRLKLRSKWRGLGDRRLEQLLRGSVECLAVYLNLEQASEGKACFAGSMIADLTEAAREFGNRAYRYVHFEVVAIGQRLYVGRKHWTGTPPP